MSRVIHAYRSGGADVDAIVEPDSERGRAWQQSIRRCFWTGSAGMVQAERFYVYLGSLGSSPMFRDERVLSQLSPEAAPEPTRTTARQTLLRMSSADQALEVLAALSLNKTLLAEVLGVTRPTLYAWLEGKDPKTENAQRLMSLVRLLGDAGVRAADALSPRFVREPLNDGEPSLLDLLRADTLDEGRVSRVLKEAKALEDGAENDRLAREARLRALGFEEPTAEQRKANLALNVALREWPKD